MKNTMKIPKVKNRVVWNFNPATRVVKSKKIYNRKKFKLKKDDYQTS